MMAKAPTRRLPAQCTRSPTSPARSGTQSDQRGHNHHSHMPPIQSTQLDSHHTPNGGRAPTGRRNQMAHDHGPLAKRNNRSKTKANTRSSTEIYREQHGQDADVAALKKRLKKALIRLKSYHHHMDLLLRERAELILATTSASLPPTGSQGGRPSAWESAPTCDAHQQEAMVQEEAQRLAAHYSPAGHPAGPATLGEGWRHPLARHSLGATPRAEFNPVPCSASFLNSSYIVLGSNDNRNYSPLFHTANPGHSTIVQRSAPVLNDLSGAVLEPSPLPLPSHARACCVLSPIPTEPRPRPIAGRHRSTTSWSSTSSTRSANVDDSTLALIEEFERNGEQGKVQGEAAHGSIPMVIRRPAVRHEPRDQGPSHHEASNAPIAQETAGKERKSAGVSPAPTSPPRSRGKTKRHSSTVEKSSRRRNTQGPTEDEAHARFVVEDDQDEVAQVTAFLNRHTLGGCGGGSFMSLSSTSFLSPK